MTMEVALSGDVLVVSLTGAFDPANSTGLGERLGRLSRPLHFASVTIDLTGCESLGTFGVGGLVGFRLSPCSSGKPFRIVGASPEVQQELSSLCMERLFVIESTP